ncbi:MAG: hypothetical protein ACYDCK_05325, partial [Thermoplasmatota archaeon]
MRVRYRIEGEKIILRVEDKDIEDARVWKTLGLAGAPLQVENDPKRLNQRRFVAREAYPRLARAAERVRATLAPEDGEAPVGAGRTHAA